MALTQKRIRELDTYIQLDVGDSGYIAPTALFVALDSADYGSEPKKYAIPNIGGSGGAAYQSDSLTGLSDWLVSVTFDTAFDAKPLVVLLNVYRYFEYEAGRFTRENVNFYLSGSTWYNTTGFTITIDDGESLTGLYIDYKFEEL